MQKKITQFNPNLATSVNYSKKCFYKYIHGKRRGKENFCSSLYVEGNVATKDKEE